MRLIDADEFYERIDNDTDLCAEMESDGLNALKKYLDLQPTAYDIDKVVEKLQSEVERWEDSGVKYGERCEIAVARGLRNAIKIVKKGGISDDVCEWEIDGVYLHSPHNRPFVTCIADDEDYRYNFCPVCGKKIKVVE